MRRTRRGSMPRAAALGLAVAACIGAIPAGMAQAGPPVPPPPAPTQHELAAVPTVTQAAQSSGTLAQQAPERRPTREDLAAAGLALRGVTVKLENNSVGEVAPPPVPLVTAQAVEAAPAGIAPSGLLGSSPVAAAAGDPAAAGVVK